MDAFKEYGVVPDVLDDAPPTKLEVAWNGKNAKIDSNIVLRPKQMHGQPHVIWETEKEAYYTLIMVDPDAPSRKNPSNREWLHWLVVNIPSNNVSEGQVKAEYIGPGPPENTGYHRYVFMVFKQPNKIDFSDYPFHSATSGKGRSQFNTRNFTERYGIIKLVSGNFVQSQCE